MGNGNTGQEFVKFFVISDSELKMTGDDTGLLVVPGGITSQLQNLGGQVLHNGGKVDGSSGTDTFSVVSWNSKLTKLNFASSKKIADLNLICS